MIMLEKLRKKIDKIDKKIAKQLSRRYQIIREIAEIKQKNDLRIYNNQREKKHLSKLMSSYENKGNFKFYLKKIFKEIFKISRDIQ